MNNDMVSDGLILEHTPSKAFRTKAQNTVHGIFNPLSQCQRTIITRQAVASTGGILFLIEDFLYGGRRPAPARLRCGATSARHPLR